MDVEFEMIAKTFQGLEEILAQELTALGANEIEIGRRMVAFKGNKEMMYKANFCLRTAIRILKPIKHFEAHDADEVYEQVKAIEWENYLSADRTFAIDSVVFSEEFRHSKFVAYRVKDAIVDYFREKTGHRPGVRVNNPDVLFNIHIAQTRCTLSLDSSGESLHRRGYRRENVEAPLNEVLAAGMILMTGWQGETDLIDPMCGSGTIPIEAALIAKNIAPGVFRKEFAFEKWADFDKVMFDNIYNDDSNEREFHHKIYAYDNNMKAIDIATNNIKSAGCSHDITLRQQPFQQFQQPTEKAVMITNPPYGERISTYDLLGLYEMIGERLKHAFAGNTAWIISYREECFDQIGLKPTKRIPLFNGPLECEFRQYEIFEGKYKDFRADGEALSKSYQSEGIRGSYGSRQEGGYDNRQKRYSQHQGIHRSDRYGTDDYQDYRPRERRFYNRPYDSAPYRKADRKESAYSNGYSERREGFGSNRNYKNDDGNDEYRTENNNARLDNKRQNTYRDHNEGYSKLSYRDDQKENTQQGWHGNRQEGQNWNSRRNDHYRDGNRYSGRSDNRQEAQYIDHPQNRRYNDISEEDENKDKGRRQRGYESYSEHERLDAAEQSLHDATEYNM